MIIRVKKTWKDFIEGDPNHKRLITRRDFCERGLLMGAMSVAVPGMLTRSAFAVNCPAPARNPGGLGQFYADGGSSGFAYLMSADMAGAASNNATVRTNYGITSNLQSIGNPSNGGNMVVAADSVFGAVLLAGVTGYTQAQWMAVLNRCSFGLIVGPNNRDDGGESNDQKVVAGLGKKSAGKDITSGNQTPISFAVGTPSSAVNSLSVTNLARTYSATPAGQTNAQTMTNAANASLALSSLFGGIFGLDGRKGGTNVTTNASCGFFGDSAVVDPNYGSQLFDPQKQSALVSVAGAPGTTSTLTNAELAMLGGFYASATGAAGGLFIDKGGYDYHGTDPTNQQAAAARALAMFLAACDKAGTRGAYLVSSNGSAIGGGPAATTITPAQNGTIGGTSNGNTTINANQTQPQGDSGGFWNGIGVVFIAAPGGSPPVTKNIGTINPGTGSVTSDPKVTSTLNAYAAAYHSAAVWLGTTTMDLAKIEAAMTKVGADWNSGHLI